MKDKKEYGVVRYEEFLKIRKQSIEKLRNDPNFRIIIDDSRYYADE